MFIISIATPQELVEFPPSKKNQYSIPESIIEGHFLSNGSPADRLCRHSDLCSTTTYPPACSHHADLLALEEIIDSLLLSLIYIERRIIVEQANSTEYILLEAFWFKKRNISKIITINMKHIYNVFSLYQNLWRESKHKKTRLFSTARRCNQVLIRSIERNLYKI